MPFLSCIGAPSLISAVTNIMSPTTTLTPLSLSSIPLMATAPLDAPALMQLASSLLPLLGTVWCTSNKSQPLPPASSPTISPFQLASSFAPIPGKLTQCIQAFEIRELYSMTTWCWRNTWRWCFGRTIRENLFHGTASTPPSILPTLVARASLPSLPVTTTMS